MQSNKPTNYFTNIFEYLTNKKTDTSNTTNIIIPNDEIYIDSSDDESTIDEKIVCHTMDDIDDSHLYKKKPTYFVALATLTAITTGIIIVGVSLLKKK